MVARGARDLGLGVWVLQSPLWQTNCVLAVVGGEALLCDPSLEPDEILALRRQVEAGSPLAVHLLVTHSDYDHTCGIPYFPAATVVASSSTAATISDGTALAKLSAGAREWGMQWPEELRVDRPVEPGEAFACGPFAVEAIEARGHVDDGAAFLLREQGVLLAGDYLSAISYPWLLGSLRDARQTCERLLAVLRHGEVRWVVPGHGPVLTAAEAMRVGEEDAAYLAALAAAAGRALALGSSPGQVLLKAYAVQPPRVASDDFEAFGLRAWNAEQAATQTREEGNA